MELACTGRMKPTPAKRILKTQKNATKVILIFIPYPQYLVENISLAQIC